MTVSHPHTPQYCPNCDRKTTHRPVVQSAHAETGTLFFACNNCGRLTSSSHAPNETNTSPAEVTTDGNP